MLCYDTIDHPTLDLLRRLQAAQEFAGMRLVGGTSLALQIGHRKSIDIDLFGKLETDSFQIMAMLKQCGLVTTLNKSENIAVYTVNGIKVDIVNYPYPWLEAAIAKEGLFLAGIKDIAAMKLAAVTNRGTKKDFVDIYFLFHLFSLEEILGFYLQKYGDGSEFMVLKSLTYFDDADLDPMPVMLRHVEWDAIKKKVVAEVENLL
jgi:hypothetical protein